MLITKALKRAMRQVNAVSVGRDKEGDRWVLLQGEIDSGTLRGKFHHKVPTDYVEMLGDKLGEVDRREPWRWFGMDWDMQSLKGLVEILPVGSRVQFRLYIDGGSENTRNAGLIHDTLDARVFNKRGKVLAERMRIDQCIIPPHSSARSWHRGDVFGSVEELPGHEE